MKLKKELKELNLIDRFLFSEAADDPEVMEILLSIIFNSDIHLKHPPQTEKEQRSTASQKQIRLDVWAMDEAGTIYDAEPQQQNPYNLPKRSRYYQSLIDSHLLKPGEIDYNKLSDTYIIIIASFDPFGRDLYRYTFCTNCREASDLILEDGAVKIFLSTKGKNDPDITLELKALLHYFEETTDEVAERSGSQKIQNLQRKINAIKASEDVGVKYMQAWEEKILERQEGFEEGIFETLGKLVQNGVLSLEQAAEQAEDKRASFLKWYENWRKQ